MTSFAMFFLYSSVVSATIDIVYEQPEDCRVLELVSAENLSDQQQAIDKLEQKVRRERGDTLLVLKITPIEVMVDNNPVRIRYDIEGLALDCDV